MEKTLTKKKILLVDDNKDTLQVLQIILEMNGYNVRSLWDGSATIGQLKEYAPDVVLLDVFLGTENGMKICNQIKGDPETSHTCVIMISAHAHEEDIMAETKADAFISKPFDIQLLTEIMDKAFGKCGDN